MNSNLHIERFLFPCLEINESAYPDIPKKKWNGLERAFFQACKDKEYIIHPYVARTEENEIYFQIHVSRISDLEHSIRFIIRKNYRLTEDQENLFFSFCHHRHVIIDEDLYRSVERSVLRFFPEIHFNHYKDQRHGLLHLYYALHASGPRELLYKAGLHKFATRLDEVDSYNYVGHSPSEIFDGIPMKLLRVLHCSWGFKLLSDRETRNQLANFCNKHAQSVNDWDLTWGQIQYILACERNEVEFHSKCLRYIFGLDHLSFKEYMDYLKHRPQVKAYYKCPLSANEIDMLLYMEVASDIWYAISHRAELDQKLQAIYKNNKCLETELDGLIVKIPHTVEEFLTEGGSLKSCIGTYARLVAEEKTLVMFVHKKSNPEKAYLALELNGEKLVQAKGKVNRDLSDEETQWLQTYCKLKSIQFALPESGRDALIDLELDDHMIEELEHILFEIEL